MTDSASCLTTSCTFPLHHVLNWSPFRIDALGIITMIGAEQVDTSVGRLVRSRYTEYLPLLGAFIFASDQFADAKSGYAVYNLTAGITTTAIAGWFSRWCTLQRFELSNSAVRWTVDGRARRRRGWWNGPQKRDILMAICIGFGINAFVLAFTVLQGDWWGFANATSMIISVAVRTYVVSKNRSALDKAVDKAVSNSKPSSPKEKVLMVLADSKMITMYVPANIVYACFVSKPEIKHKGAYYRVRMIGWAGFTVQVIALGMSGLATQIITVLVMIVSTIMVHFRVGCDDHIIGTRLRAERCDFGPGKTRRKDVYVALDLEKHEEDCMLAWNLMPHRTSPGAKEWWDDYNNKKRAYSEEERSTASFGSWEKRPVAQFEKDTSPV